MRGKFLYAFMTLTKIGQNWMGMMGREFEKRRFFLAKLNRLLEGLEDGGKRKNNEKRMMLSCLWYFMLRIFLMFSRIFVIVIILLSSQFNAHVMRRNVDDNNKSTLSYGQKLNELASMARSVTMKSFNSLLMVIVESMKWETA